MLNIFGGHVTEEWVEESWSVPSSREELIAAKAGWNEALLDMFRHVEHVFKWGIYDRDPLPQWTRGRVTLLGDAAHPTMPTWRKAPTWRSRTVTCWRGYLSRHGEDVETALQAYPAERQPRTDWVTLQSRQQFADNTQSVAAAVHRPHLAVRLRRHPGGGGAATGLASGSKDLGSNVQVASTGQMPI